MSYPIESLQNLSESITQGLSVSRYREKDKGSGTLKLVVNVKDLENLYLEHNLEQIELKNDANIQKYLLRKNDVVIAIRGSLLKSSVITETSQGSISGSNVAVFRPANLDRVDPVYIAVLMRSQWMQNSLHKLTSRSSITLPSIRVSDLRNFKIPLPSISTQQKIVDLFSLFESYRKITLDTLSARQELTESFLIQLLQ